MSAVGFRLSKSLGATVKLDPVLPGNGEVARDPWAGFCGRGREFRLLIPGSGSIGTGSVPEVAMVG